MGVLGWLILGLVAGAIAKVYSTLAGGRRSSRAAG
jgi:hypothetical protein